MVEPCKREIKEKVATCNPSEVGEENIGASLVNNGDVSGLQATGEVGM